MVENIEQIVGEERNPFEVIGIHPELLRRIGDGEAFNILKTLHRALSLMYHPDRTQGDKKAEEIFKEVSKAWEKLDPEGKPEEWIQYKKELLQPRTVIGEIEALRKKITELQKEQILTGKGFIEYMKTMTGTVEDTLTIFNLTPQKGERILYMHDETNNINEAPDRDEVLRDFTQKPNSTYYDIIITSDGTIYYDKGKGREEQKGKIIVGSVFYNTMNQTPWGIGRTGYGILGFMKRAQNIRTASEVKEQKTDMENRRYIPAGTREATTQEQKTFVNRIPQEKFCTAILPHIHPEIEIPQKINDSWEGGGYLFTLNITGEEGYFSLEGQINGMEIRSKKKETRNRKKV